MFRYLLTLTLFGVFSLGHLAFADPNGDEEKENASRHIPRPVLESREEKSSEGACTSDDDRFLEDDDSSEESSEGARTSDDDRFLEDNDNSEESSEGARTSDDDRFLEDNDNSEESSEGARTSDDDRFLEDNDNSEDELSTKRYKPSPGEESASNSLEIVPCKTEDAYSAIEEKKFFSPIRRAIFALKYDGNGKRRQVSSEDVCNVIKQFDTGKYFVRKVFREKFVFLASQLFDPYALVLDKDGKWVTNLSLMERGLCPIGHDGIADEDTRKSGNHENIRKKQKEWRIELQHVLQNDKCPLLEMTHQGHMGLNARLLGRINPQAESPDIVYTSLEIEEALLLMQQDPTLFMATNLLHFEMGETKVGDRKEFREAYWKWRAERFKVSPLKRRSLNETSKIFSSPPRPSQRVLRLTISNQLH